MIDSYISVLENCSIRIRYPKRSVADHRKTKPNPWADAAKKEDGKEEP